MSSPINYADMVGEQGELNLSLRLTYNGIETPFQATQRVVIKHFKSALYDNAVKDARKYVLGAEDAIYVYMAQNGFMPLSITAEVPQTTTQTAEPKGKSQSVQSKPRESKPQPSVKEQPHQQKPSVQSKPQQQSQPTVQEKSSKKRNNSSTWVLVVGLSILGLALIFLCVILYQPSEATYDVILDEIFDGFKFDSDTIKHTFDKGFEADVVPFFAKMFGSKGMPNFARSVIYAICWLVFAVGLFFWIVALLGFVFGLYVLVRSLF